MSDPRHAIIPGIVIATAVLILFTHQWAPPEKVEAATEQPAVAASVMQAEENQARGWKCEISPRLIDSVRQWCSEIEEISAKYDLDASLVAAVMTQESGGQSEIISASGAVGLMQVMPRDGIAAKFVCTNGPCFASRPSSAELLDPLFNLDFGTRMLAGLIKKYGNPRDALQAYGPYNVGYTYADKVLAIQQHIQ